MQLVVLIAVSAAVKTDIASWITDFQKSLFFITLFFCSFLRREERTKEAFPLLNLPQGEDLIDFGLMPFIKVFLYRSQSFRPFGVSDKISLASLDF